MRRNVAALLAVLALPALAHAREVWRGDFETGDLSQWSAQEKVSPGRLQVVTSPTREGRYALQATVRRGDDPIQASGNRNELVYASDEAEGSEYYYKWSTRFAPDYPSANTWQVFTQWHHEGCCGSPPLEFFVYGEKMHLRVGGSFGQVLWTAPLVRGEWQDFVLHVRWSPDPTVGFVELFHEGRRVVPRVSVATQYPGARNYLKLGLYRDEAVRPVGVVFHDGMVQATAAEDVLPPELLEQAPGAGAPASQTPVPPPAPASSSAGADRPSVTSPVPLEEEPRGCAAGAGPLALAAWPLVALAAGRVARRRRRKG